MSGRAPQLIVTNGPSARPDSPWMAFATSSLPVPLSPVTSTVELVGAMARTISKSEAMTCETPITRSRP